MRSVISNFSAAVVFICGSQCALAQPPLAQPPPAAPVAQQTLVPEPATIDGCQMVARINGQVVLACELLWQVNLMIEENRDRIPPEQLEEVRGQLMRRQLANGIDAKILYNEFRRSVPAENMPRIEENLREPFEDREVPRLMKELEVNNRRELEQKLASLGSSIDDTRRAFNEGVIAREWVRTKIKIDEEMTPDDLLDYYRAHLTDYEYPTKTRWEELMVRKDRFSSPREAYAEMARLGNLAWQAAAASTDPASPVFGELAKSHSDGLNAKEGGVHDWTTQGALKAQAIDQALFSLPVGQLSPDIIQSETGFHIVRVLERKEAGRRPFTEVQNDIRESLKDERYRAAVNTYLAELRRDARIWTVYTGPVSADVLLGRSPDDTKRR